ncbi:sensor histidine kinase [Beijerinckia indica]|uniref:histidine kinase n=1 Tax=Beijerinckia indica subsp. indica (strain ATCC 9039 / DSM 1715 / NCIMB 8712) TaxID=395963 RepID=B2IEF5_BEII9|nr:HAMP domain-containing sensor histidine kinase [Beijerinckia indica]ACB95553.1 integral membrane sensor signal transduction histidine kinase [Beijerinckia indica subsp. indica ATCC 9039]
MSAIVANSLRERPFAANHFAAPQDEGKPRQEGSEPKQADEPYASKPDAPSIADPGIRSGSPTGLGSGSGEQTFALELAQTYARKRLASLPLLAGLDCLLAAVGLAWLDGALVAGWLGFNLLGLTLVYHLLTRFLTPSDVHCPTPSELKTWQTGFVLGEGLHGLVWGLFIGLIVEAGGEPALTIGLVFALAIGATNLRLTAPIPACVFGPLLPMATAIAIISRLTIVSQQAMPLAGLASAVLLYFLVTAQKIRAGVLEKLTIQNEKDELITELEQARVNSDLARRRAEEANLAKSRFLATMSHELRTPLNAILGFSEVMKGELFGAHVISSYKDYSNDIHASGQHLLTLINEILDLSRIEAGHLELRDDCVALAHVVDDCRHLLALKAKKRGLTIEEHVEPDLPRLRADERALRQVALNLLTNAVKFTPPGGWIKIKIGWTANGGQYVSIHDSGPGIPEEEMPIVMSSFGRGTLAQKNALEGSGLGLPIVKGLVDLHNGTFSLKSRLHEGTEAIVVLPAERVLAANAAPSVVPLTVSTPTRLATESIGDASTPNPSLDGLTLNDFALDKQALNDLVLDHFNRDHLDRACPPRSAA